MAKEYPALRCKCIDVGTATNALILINLLASELKREMRKNFESVALRSQTRFIQSVRPIEDVIQSKERTRFKPGGIYLVTGGSGGMAKTFVQKIGAAHQNVTFVLLGRRAVAEEGGSPATGKNGCRVYHLECDVSDSQQLKRTVSQIEKKIGRINGIIHAAGVADFGGIIHLRNRDSYQDVFKAKVYGTINLYHVFYNRQLDFFVLCSSVSAFSAPAGECGYVAANLFLDSFAQYACRTTSLNPVSIGWNRWREVGMALANGASDNSTENITFNSISPNQGYQLLELALNLGLPHVVLSKYNLLSLWRGSIDVQPTSSDTQFKPVHKADFLQRSAEETLLAMWSEYFGKRVQTQDDFFQIGGDSLKALTIIERMHKVFNVAVPIPEFFANPTIEGLVAYIRNASASTKPDIAFSAIKQAEIKSYYPLSSAQKRLYLLHEFDKTSLAYNIPHVLNIDGLLDKNRLEWTFRKLLARHESLRTCFELHPDMGPVQRVVEDASFDIEWMEVPDMDIDDMIRQFIKPFDLSNAPLIRVAVFQRSETHHTMLVDIHHIVSDGISVGLLITEFTALFKGEVLPALNLQYKDYAVWQQEDRQRSLVEKQKEFWIEEFKSGVPVLFLPTDMRRPLIKSFQGDAVMFLIERNETQQLKAIAEKYSCTIYMLILAIYNIFLSKLSGQDDIVVGTGTSGRQHADLETMIGMFVNTLAVRNQPYNNLPFVDFLASVKSKTLQCFNNQSHPYEELLDNLKLERDMSRNPLFDVMFAYQNFEHPEIKIPGLDIRSYNPKLVVSKFDITLSGTEDTLSNRLIFTFEYCTQLFDRSTIDRFCIYFKRIVSAVISNTNVLISNIEIIPDEEKVLVLNGFGRGASIIHRPDLLEIIAGNARRYPDMVAFSVVDRTGITFKELNTRASKLANYLAGKFNINHTDVIGILCTDPISIVVGMLACWKIGAAYAYFDSNDLDRAAESPGKCTIILTDEEYYGTASGIKVVELTREFATIASQVESDLPSDKTNTVGYMVIGDQHEEVILRQNLLNQVHWFAKKVSLSPGNSLLSLDSPNSLTTQRDIFASLMVGSVFVSLGECHYNASSIAKVVEDREISVLSVTPPALYALLHYNTSDEYARIQSLRHIIVRSGTLHAAPLRRWANSPFCKATVHNTYSPANSSGVISCLTIATGELKTLQQFSVGRPIDNTLISINDSVQKPVPIGVCGEVYVSRVDTFGSSAIDKTGHAGKWLPNGELSVVRRQHSSQHVDEEIEGILLEDPEIYDVLVENVELGGKTELVAYYSANNRLRPEKLAMRFSDRLPAHLVPHDFIYVSEMPLRNDGTINTKLLPTPVFRKMSYQAPESELEKMLVRFWQQILGVTRVGIHDNFFELGGNSLSTMRLLNAIKKELNLDVTIGVLFKVNTVRLLAQRLETQIAEAVPVEEDNFEELKI
jgi:non-ribosomal peptide synthetase component F/NADP-dependent 3-hydroxy acid dehydrogenase YdfG